MEYKKETEKFSAGFGMESGMKNEEIQRIKAEIAKNKKKETTAAEDLIQAIVGVVALAAMTFFKLKFGKTKKQKKAEKKAKKKAKKAEKKAKKAEKKAKKAAKKAAKKD